MDETLLKISSVLFLAWILAGAPISFFYSVKAMKPSADAPSWEGAEKFVAIQKGIRSGEIEVNEDETELHENIIDAYDDYINSDCEDYEPLAQAMGALMSNTLKNQGRNDLYEYVDDDLRHEAGQIFNEALSRGYVVKSDFSWGLRRMIPAGNQRGSACH